jgi:hypothetical protein
VRVTTSIPEDADLGTCGQAVNEAKTPHKGQSAPGLALVVFAKLDEASAKKAEEALGKVKGIDAEGTKADVKRGEISVKIAGGEKLTVGGILEALKGAGVEASATAPKKGKS